MGASEGLWRPSRVPAGAHPGGIRGLSLRLWRRGRLLQWCGDASMDLQHQGEYYQSSTHMRPYLDDIKNWRDKINTKIKGQREKTKITSIIDQGQWQYQYQ